MVLCIILIASEIKLGVKLLVFLLDMWLTEQKYTKLLIWASWKAKWYKYNNIRKYTLRLGNLLYSTFIELKINQSFACSFKGFNNLSCYTRLQDYLTNAYFERYWKHEVLIYRVWIRLLWCLTALMAPTDLRSLNKFYNYTYLKGLYSKIL